MTEMFGLSRPVPAMMSSRPSQTKNGVGTGTAMLMWPHMMTNPPQSTDLRGPRIRSAIHPPGSATR